MGYFHLFNGNYWRSSGINKIFSLDFCEVEKMIFKVSPDIWQKAREMTDSMEKAVADRNYQNKFMNSKAVFDSERYGRLIGCVGEVCFSKIYGMPLKEVDGKLDKFDFEFNGLKIDLKTHEGKGDLLINCTQFYRKKNSIDAFAFGRIFDNYFEPLGWVDSKIVEKRARVKSFANGSKAFVINLSILKPFSELLEGKVEQQVQVEVVL